MRSGRPEAPVRRPQLGAFLTERVETFVLDLGVKVEHADVVGCAAQRPRVHARQGVQRSGRSHVVRHPRLDRADELDTRSHRVAEQLDQDLVLAGEVVIQRLLPDADSVGDGPRRGS
jgi:hypothetical protein